jgi:hypothetical protein
VAPELASLLRKASKSECNRFAVQHAVDSDARDRPNNAKDGGKITQQQRISASAHRLL